jgi:pimeloyl-ACP methyl ester carboxylesterase
MSDAVVLLAHGAGSSIDAVRRLLGGLAPGAAEIAVDSRGSALDVVDRLTTAAHGHRVVVAGGISLGAHAVALWAHPGGSAEGLVLALPAWTGEPGAVAALTRSTAQDVTTRGRDAVLAEIRGAAPDDWVTDELSTAWAGYTDAELVAALEAAASSAGPTLAELGTIRVPCAVVALADDPLHPLDVAEEWAAAIPRSRLVVVPRDAPLTQPDALARAGRRALARLSGSR